MPNEPRPTTSVIPNLSVRNGTRAVDFYKSAFGANELSRITNPDGEVVAEMSIDGARFFVADEAPEHKNFSPSHLAVAQSGSTYSWQTPMRCTDGRWLLE